jgi:secretion/DNA translocation related TadE-like protein
MRNRDRSPDDGSGSLFGLALVGSIGALVVLTIPLCTGLAIRQSVATAADAAALATADVAAGIAPGVPCDVARTVATANRAVLGACSVDGLVVTVRAQSTFLGLTLAATATAGPPGAVTN